MVTWHKNFLNSNDVIEQGWKDLVKITLILLLKVVAILCFNFVFFKIKFDFYLSVNIELHSDEVMDRETLTEWLIQL